MAVERAFLVKLVGDAKQLINEFQKTEKASQGLFGKDGLGGKLKDMLPSFKTVAIAGAAAFGAVTAAMYQAVKAAAEDQESQRRLAEQLRRTTGATDEQIASVEKLIAKQEIAVGVADTELRGALGNLVRATGDVSLAQDQLGLALDISAATGKDLEGVSLALGKAFTGNISALTRLGIPLDQSVIKSKDLSEVVKTLNTQFGGAAAAAADTFSGRMRILKISLDNVVEGIGYALLPLAERLVKAVQERVVPVLTAFASALQDGKGLRGALVAAGGEAGAFGLKIINVVEGIAKTFATFGNFMISVGAPILLLLRELAEGLTLLKTGSFDAARTAGQSFTDIYNTVTNAKVSIDDLGASFQRFRKDVLAAGVASTLTQQELRNLEHAARQSAAGMAVVKPFIGPLLDGYGALAPKVKSTSEFLKEFGDEVKKAGGKASSAASSVKTAADKLKEYTKVLKQAQSASKAFGDSQKRVSNAAKSVAEADRELAEAQEALLKAQEGKSPAEIADAQRALAAAERGLARAKFGQERAVFAVAEAERRLAEVRGDPDSTPEAIRKAEIDLAEAKFAVVDAEDNQIDVAKRLNQARRELRIATNGLIEGDRELLPLQDAVTRAQQRQKDASEAYQEAIENQTEALNRYREALEELGKTARNFPKIARNVGQPGLLPVDGVPMPLPVGGAAGAVGAGSPTVVVNVTAGIGGNAYQVGKEIIEVLDQYTSVAGPLDTLMRVA